MKYMLMIYGNEVEYNQNMTEADQQAEMAAYYAFGSVAGAMAKRLALMARLPRPRSNSEASMCSTAKTLMKPLSWRLRSQARS